MHDQACQWSKTIIIIKYNNNFLNILCHIHTLGDDIPFRQGRCCANMSKLFIIKLKIVC